MLQMAITPGKVIQMGANCSGLTFRYTEAGMEKGVKGNVNVIYSPAQCYKAAQL